MTYSFVDREIVLSLQGIVGEKNVIYADDAALEAYAHDEVMDKKYHHLPEVVVKPASVEEVAAIVRLANDRLIPLTPRGAGSGLSGGAVPVFGGIVLSLERMNKVIEIDRTNLMIVVEPGVITNEINNILKEYGLFYAGYPMSMETCFIGGNVAENAGGGKAVKYGVTDRYVCGLEVVLPTGEVIQLGGKLVKDVTGYNILHLMVGSEGTLGIITKVFLKLLPLPKYRADLLVLFKDMEAAITMVPEIITNGKIIPAAIEFMDRLSFETSCRYLHETLPYEEANAMLLIEVDGNSSTQIEEDYLTIGELCNDHGAIEVYVADNVLTTERVWKIRRNIAEAIKAFFPMQSLEDIVVPVSEIPTIIRGILEISARYGCTIPCYGHAGDGNLHATPVKPTECDDNRWDSILQGVLEEMYRAARRLGGTISGEHGIGSKRLKYMPLVMSQVELELMRKIKVAFDPNHILNPGKAC